MWIKWNQPRQLSVAADDKTSRIINIVPGTQFVDDADWNFARPSVADKIKRKELEEIGAKVETDRKGPGGKSMPDHYVGADFNDLPTEQQESIIDECLSFDCLENLKKTVKESVRVRVVNRIEDLKSKYGKK